MKTITQRKTLAAFIIFGVAIVIMALCWSIYSITHHQDKASLSSKDISFEVTEIDPLANELEEMTPADFIPISYDTFLSTDTNKDIVKSFNTKNDLTKYLSKMTVNQVGNSIDGSKFSEMKADKPVAILVHTSSFKNPGICYPSYAYVNDDGNLYILMGTYELNPSVEYNEDIQSTPATYGILYFDEADVPEFDKVIIAVQPTS